MRRREFLLLTTAAAVAPAAARSATLYKNPECGCYEEHAKYRRRHGYGVTVVPTHDLDRIKSEHGVPEPLYGCHTLLVGGYVIEGHVSVGVLDRLLRERPAIRGISLPGMPAGSPPDDRAQEGALHDLRDRHAALRRAAGLRDRVRRDDGARRRGGDG